MIPLMSNNKVFFVKKLKERKKDHMFKSIYNSHFFSPHVSRAQRLAPARTRTRVVRLRAQCTDHWTTSQSRGVDGPAAHLTKHVKSSTLCGRTVVRSYNKIFSAWWMTAILYNYRAMLCELRYNSSSFTIKWISLCSAASKCLFVA